MAVLKWEDVAFNPMNVGQGPGASVALLNEGLTGLSDSLGKYEARQARDAGVAGIGKAMKYTTAEQFRQAAANGELDINETNIDFFENREKELLANEQTQVQTQGYKIDNQGKLVDIKGKEVQIEGWRIDNKGKILDNEGKVIGNAQQSQKLQESQYDFGQKKDQDAAELEAAPIMAQIAEAGNAGTPEGRAKANQLTEANAALLVRAGIPLADIPGIDDETLIRIGKGVAADKTLRDKSLANEDNAEEDKGKKLFQDFYNNNSYINYEDALKALRATPNMDPRAIHKAETMLAANKDIMFPQADVEKSLQEQSIKEGYKPPSAQGGALYNLLGQTEGNFKANTLFSHAQDRDSPFRGVDVSRMTIGELNKMAPEYGKWVAQRNNGVEATPMGMFQIVNSTLQEAAKELGMDENTVFDVDTQMKLFTHLVDRRLSGQSTMQGKMDAIRKEWVGLGRENVSDNVLAAAISSYESGDRQALQSMMDPEGGGAAAVGNDPTTIENGIMAAAKKGIVPAQMNQALYDVAKERNANAVSTIQQMTLDTSFGGDKAAVLQAFVNPTNRSIGQLGGDIKQAYKEIAPDVPDELAEETESSGIREIDKAVKDTMRKYSVTPEVALQLVKGATAQGGVLNFTQGNMVIDYDQIDDYVKTVINMDIKNPQERLDAAKATLQEQAAKATGAQNLTTLQKDYQAAMTDYYSAASRKRADPKSKVNDVEALQRVTYIGQKLQAEIDRIRKSPVSTANVAAAGSVGGQ